MSKPTKIELVVLDIARRHNNVHDLLGGKWRLAVDAAPPLFLNPVVVLEHWRRDPVDEYGRWMVGVEGWSYCGDVTRKLDEVGAMLVSGAIAGSPSKHLELVDGVKARERLRREIEDRGVREAPAGRAIEYAFALAAGRTIGKAGAALGGLAQGSAVHALGHDGPVGTARPAPPLDDPPAASTNVLDFSMRLEQTAASPASSRAIAARKLREAFYLLQDTQRMIQAQREAVERLTAKLAAVGIPFREQDPGKRMDGWHETLTLRVAGFPSVEEPAGWRDRPLPVTASAEESEALHTLVAFLEGYRSAIMNPAATPDPSRHTLDVQINAVKRLMRTKP